MARVGWDTDQDGYVTDHFLIGHRGEVWMIDKLRMWAVPELAAGRPTTLGDLFTRITLFGGIESEHPPATPEAAAAECACHGPVRIAATDLRAGSNTALDKQVLLTPATYSDGSVYREGERLLPVWLVDFQNLRWSVPGGVNIQFGVFGQGRSVAGPGTRATWFSHASSTSESHQFRLFGVTGNPVVLASGSPKQDESMGINVQVWGHLSVEVSIRPLGNRWQIVLLGSATFDVRQVEAESLRFGPKQAVPGDWHVEDHNGDGQPDLVMRIGGLESGVQVSQMTACLSGVRADGVRFGGCDTLTGVGKR